MHSEVARFVGPQTVMWSTPVPQLSAWGNDPSFQGCLAFRASERCDSGWTPRLSGHELLCKDSWLSSWFPHCALRHHTSSLLRQRGLRFDLFMDGSFKFIKFMLRVKKIYIYRPLHRLICKVLPTTEKFCGGGAHSKSTPRH